MLVKIAVSGKGGVGKTTLSAMLAGVLALKDRQVIAVDADPDANLAAALGIPPQQEPIPICQMRELIAERTGSADNYGGYFKLNPKVDDIPAKYARKVGSIRLLTLGGVSKGGGGCICPASALIRALMTHLILRRDETIIMDMEAGIEHLGRATAQAMDAMVVVVEASPWSLRTARRVRDLAGDIGISSVLAVANRLGDDSDLRMIEAALEDIPLIGHLPWDDRLKDGILSAELEGGKIQPRDALRGNLEALEAMLSALENRT